MCVVLQDGNLAQNHVSNVVLELLGRNWDFVPVGVEVADRTVVDVDLGVAFVVSEREAWLRILRFELTQFLFLGGRRDVLPSESFHFSIWCDRWRRELIRDFPSGANFDRWEFLGKIRVGPDHGRVALRLKRNFLRDFESAGWFLLSVLRSDRAEITVCQIWFDPSPPILRWALRRLSIWRSQILLFLFKLHHHLRLLLLSLLIKPIRRILQFHKVFVFLKHLGPSLLLLHMPFLDPIDHLIQKLLVTLHILRPHPLHLNLQIWLAGPKRIFHSAQEKDWMETLEKLEASGLPYEGVLHTQICQIAPCRLWGWGRCSDEWSKGVSRLTRRCIGRGWSRKRASERNSSIDLRTCLKIWKECWLEFQIRNLAWKTGVGLKKRERKGWYRSTKYRLISSIWFAWWAQGPCSGGCHSAGRVGFSGRRRCNGGWDRNRSIWRRWHYLRMWTLCCLENGQSFWAYLAWCLDGRCLLSGGSWRLRGACSWSGKVVCLKG